MNDFRKEGGGTIRMLGIINEIAEIYPNIILISNIEDQEKVSYKVKHIEIGKKFSDNEKRKLQFWLSVSGVEKINVLFPELLISLKDIFTPYKANSKIIFFEYLDNSIGFWLKKNKVVNTAINDIHGIASNEFSFQARKAKNLKTKFLFKCKEKIANRLDKKVFNYSDGIIYASNAMFEYFVNLYPSIKNKKNYYLPYVLSNQNIKQGDPSVSKRLRTDLNICNNDFIFLFAGGFKETGGIQDLIIAFSEVNKAYPQSKLLLIGDGPTFGACERLIASLKNSERVYLLGRQPYEYLASFQDLSNVLVCPDRQNLFSDLIVHVKYLDALVSGKLVINGKFKSVQEINEKQKLSLLFNPSDIRDLIDKMNYSIQNYPNLMRDFEFSKQYTLENLSYQKFIQNIIS